MGSAWPWPLDVDRLSLLHDIGSGQGLELRHAARRMLKAGDPQEAARGKWLADVAGWEPAKARGAILALWVSRPVESLWWGVVELTPPGLLAAIRAAWFALPVLGDLSRTWLRSRRARLRRLDED
jgi:hypothetical protein